MKRCRVCNEEFAPRNSMQKVCSPWCALSHVAAQAEKKAKKAAKADRKLTRAQLEALKTIPQLKKEAQREFNRFIRARDHNRDCISCGAKPPDLGQLHAGRDAGHYRGTGAADHLRFMERNCHAQCVRCNQWGAGAIVEYRRGLIERIGVDIVEALENDNTPVKWTREKLREIRDTYRAKARELEKQWKSS